MIPTLCGEAPIFDDLKLILLEGLQRLFFSALRFHFLGATDPLFVGAVDCLTKNGRFVQADFVHDRGDGLAEVDTIAG